ncbi:MAG: GNAT family N-acetyltransferase [Defluviitaleaceae bacterium]|nr:GNAT family N-acetyltransferase [Defluviitaleaceae bacterium]
MSTNVVLTSERLIYRPYKMEDIDALVKLCNEKTYRRWFYFLPKLNPKRAKDQIENNIKMWSRKIDITKDQFFFAIEKKDAGELIGSVHVSKYHGKKELKDFEVGFDIGEAYQNKGYATEAVHEVLKWAFVMLSEISATPKVVGKAEHKNFASRKVLEKAGFTFVKKTLFCHVHAICLS